MIVETNVLGFEKDIFDVVHLFYPQSDFNVDDGLKISHKLFFDDLKMKITLEFFDGNILQKTMEFPVKNDLTRIEEKRIQKRHTKKFLYDFFCEKLGKKLPWGCLTGIRPTKFARDLIEEGNDPVFIGDLLIKEYGVSEQKAELVQRTLKNQKAIIKNDCFIDIYVNIPICPSRCSYCSFISSEMDKVKDLIPTYLKCLIKEIREVKRIIDEKPYIVKNIYIGGGTPTILNPMELDLLLSELEYPQVEFTVECGRADTITNEKLAVLKKYGVTRISINPQTFSNKTLKTIGRKHTTQDVLDAYKLALYYGFNVNMDLIAGLEGESLNTFKNNIKLALELSPDNLTIHTLSIKRGSLLQDEKIENDQVEKMVNYAYEKLSADGYRPYYLYRQKNQLGGLENVGYTKKDKACQFNIDSMEETCSIIACGANAVSKKVDSLNSQVLRTGNVKFIQDYINRIDEMIQNKKELFLK